MLKIQALLTFSILSLAFSQLIVTDTFLGYSLNYDQMVDFYAFSDMYVFASNDVAVTYDQSQETWAINPYFATCSGTASNNFYCVLQSASNIIEINQINVTTGSLLSYKYFPGKVGQFVVYYDYIYLLSSWNNFNSFSILDTNQNSLVCNVTVTQSYYIYAFYQGGNYVLLMPESFTNGQTIKYLNYSCSTNQSTIITVNVNIPSVYQLDTNVFFDGETTAMTAFAVFQNSTTSLYTTSGYGYYFYNISSSSYVQGAQFKGYLTFLQINSTNIVILDYNFNLIQYKYNFETNQFAQVGPSLLMPQAVNLISNEGSQNPMLSATLMLASFQVFVIVDLSTMTYASISLQNPPLQFSNGTYFIMNSSLNAYFLINSNEVFVVNFKNPLYSSYQLITSNIVWGFGFDFGIGCFLLCVNTSSSSIYNVTFKCPGFLEQQIAAVEVVGSSYYVALQYSSGGTTIISNSSGTLATGIAIGTVSFSFETNTVAILGNGSLYTYSISNFNNPSYTNLNKSSTVVKISEQLVVLQLTSNSTVISNNLLPLGVVNTITGELIQTFFITLPTTIYYYKFNWTLFNIDLTSPNPVQGIILVLYGSSLYNYILVDQYSNEYEINATLDVLPWVGGSNNSIIVNYMDNETSFLNDVYEVNYISLRNSEVKFEYQFSHFSGIIWIGAISALSLSCFYWKIKDRLDYKMISFENKTPLRLLNL